MLSHENIVSNFKAVSYIPPFGEEAKSVSYLPLCHIYERMLNYVYQYLGISVYYAENLGTIIDNMKEVRPQMLTTVPRLLEKFYDKLINQRNTAQHQNGKQRQLYQRSGETYLTLI